MVVRALYEEDEEIEAQVPPTPSPAPRFPVEAVVTVLTSIGAVLGTRVVLICALAFAFILATGAQHAATVGANWSLGLFLTFCFCPVVALASVRRV